MSTSLPDSRSARWRTVWAGRNEQIADWNGYDACFGSLEEYEAWETLVVQALQRALSFSPTDVVADLGCGTGRIASRVGSLVANVIGYDYSDTVVDLARRRRARANCDFHLADLSLLDPATTGANKAYAVASLLYLDSTEQVYSLIERFSSAKISFAAIDLPDAAIPDLRPRSYDTAVYDHLRFDERELRGRFPGCVIERGAFPGYVNGPSRFNFYLRP